MEQIHYEERFGFCQAAQDLDMTENKGHQDLTKY